MNVSIGFAKRVCVSGALAMSGIVSVAHADVVISSQPTKNVRCSAGVCSTTRRNANLNVSDLANDLAAGDVTIVSGSTAMDIQFGAPLSWTSKSRLTLDAYRSVTFEQPVSVTGKGALTITTDDGGSGGDFSFIDEGQVQFWNAKSSLVINGVSYMLVRTVAELSEAAQFDCPCALRRDYDARRDGTYSTSPVDTTFVSTLEGLGNSISNLKINSPSSNQVGLIYQLSDFSHAGAGVVRDLKLLKISIYASADTSDTGAVAGQNYGTISGTQVTGTLSDGTYMGGFTAENYGVIRTSMFQGTMTGGSETDYVGGFVGYNNDGTLSNLSANVSIADSPDAEGGGIAGDNFGSISSAISAGSIDTGLTGGIAGDNELLIAASSSSASVSGQTDGGIAAINGVNGAIQRSFATAKVVGGAAAGGVAADNSGLINQSYSTGSVSGNGRLGGVAGLNSGMIAESYASGAIHSHQAYDVGGAIGDDTNGNSVTATYWDLDRSGISDPNSGCGTPRGCVGVAGLTTDQFKSGLPAGFDPSIWAEKKHLNSGFPYLLANPPPK